MSLIGQVIHAVRSERAAGHGQAWERLLLVEDDIDKWVKDGLTLTNVHGKLERQGVVPYRTLHRFAVERCGFGRRQATVRIADGVSGMECRLDFGRLGMMHDPMTGRRRTVHALIFTSVVSRHAFVWLSFTQTLADVIAGCEAAGGPMTVPKSGSNRSHGRGRRQHIARRSRDGCRETWLGRRIGVVTGQDVHAPTVLATGETKGTDESLRAVTLTRLRLTSRLHERSNHPWA